MIVIGFKNINFEKYKIHKAFLITEFYMYIKTRHAVQYIYK